MDTKELRIGNYIKHRGRLVTVKNIFTKSVNLEIEKETHRVNKYVPAAEIEPIPLTSEIMYRLGFRKDYHLYKLWTPKDYTGANIYVKRIVENYVVLYDRNDTRLCEVKHLHELQNVIRYIFGIELRLRRY